MSLSDLLFIIGMWLSIPIGWVVLMYWGWLDATRNMTEEEKDELLEYIEKEGLFGYDEDLGV